MSNRGKKSGTTSSVSSTRTTTTSHAGTTASSLARRSGVTHSYKFCVGGPASAGKTSLVTRATKATFSDTYRATPSPLPSQLTVTITPPSPVPEQRIQLQIWDAPGNESRLNLLPHVCRSSYAILLVFDVCNRESFDQIEVWFNRFQQVMNDVRTAAAASSTNGVAESHQVCYGLCGTKADANADDRRVVSRAEAEALATRLGLQPYVECSALEDESPLQVFQQLALEVFLVRHHNRTAGWYQRLLEKERREKDVADREIREREQKSLLIKAEEERRLREQKLVTETYTLLSTVTTYELPPALRFDSIPYKRIADRDDAVAALKSADLEAVKQFASNRNARKDALREKEVRLVERRASLPMLAALPEDGSQSTSASQDNASSSVTTTDEETKLASLNSTSSEDIDREREELDRELNALQEELRALADDDEVVGVALAEAAERSKAQSTGSSSGKADEDRSKDEATQKSQSEIVSLEQSEPAKFAESTVQSTHDKTHEESVENATSVPTHMKPEDNDSQATSLQNVAEAGGNSSDKEKSKVSEEEKQQQSEQSELKVQDDTLSQSGSTLSSSPPSSAQSSFSEAQANMSMPALVETQPSREVWVRRSRKILKTGLRAIETTKLAVHVSEHVGDVRIQMDADQSSMSSGQKKSSYMKLEEPSEQENAYYKAMRSSSTTSKRDQNKEAVSGSGEGRDATTAKDTAQPQTDASLTTVQRNTHTHTTVVIADEPEQDDDDLGYGYCNPFCRRGKCCFIVLFPLIVIAFIFYMIFLGIRWTIRKCCPCCMCCSCCYEEVKRKKSPSILQSHQYSETTIVDDHVAPRGKSDNYGSINANAGEKASVGANQSSNPSAAANEPLLTAREQAHANGMFTPTMTALGEDSAARPVSSLLLDDATTTNVDRQASDAASVIYEDYTFEDIEYYEECIVLKPGESLPVDAVVIAGPSQPSIMSSSR